jgi:hypothetical protein
MSAATPGPWFVHDGGVAYGQVRPFNLTVRCESRAYLIVACMEIGITGTMEEARANARLIAASPEMLSALRVAASYLGMIPQSGDRDVTQMIIQDAIRKAEGAV